MPAGLCVFAPYYLKGQNKDLLRLRAAILQSRGIGANLKCTLCSSNVAEEAQSKAVSGLKPQRALSPLSRVLVQSSAQLAGCRRPNLVLPSDETILGVSRLLAHHHSLNSIKLRIRNHSDNH